MNKLKNLCLVSTIMHTTFIGWLTWGAHYFDIFIIAVPACFILMPLVYFTIYKTFNFLNKYLKTPIDNNYKYLTMTILGEITFILLYVPTSMAVIVISHSN